MPRWYLIACILVLAVSAGRTARAEKPRVDWKRGLLIGSGAAAGDLRSPTRQLARVKATRQAKTRCQGALMEAAAKIALAGGKKRMDAKKLDLLAEGLVHLGVDHGSDGSVVVEMALPLDGLRSLFFSSDIPLAGQGGSASPVLVDARGLKLKPAIGYTLTDEDNNSYRGPTVFFDSEREARKDARLGKDATLVRAVRLKGDTLKVELGVLGRMTRTRPLVVILWRGT